MKNFVYLVGLALLGMGGYVFFNYDALPLDGEAREMAPLMPEGSIHLIKTSLSGLTRKCVVFFPSRYYHQQASIKRSAWRAARVIALPGEEVAMLSGKVYIDKQPLDESYATLDTTGQLPPLKIPARHCFVLIDDRTSENFTDSRHWGLLAFELIRGYKNP